MNPDTFRQGNNTGAINVSGGKSDGKQLVAVYVNSSFEDIPINVSLPKAWAKKMSSLTSYRTDARHDLCKTITGKGLDHTIGARGVTTIVIDF
jgi:hypothetical protein